VSARARLPGARSLLRIPGGMQSSPAARHPTRRGARRRHERVGAHDDGERDRAVPGGAGGPFSIRHCALDVLALLDALGVASVRAVGLSLGAKALLHVATRAAERTAAEWAAMRASHRHGDAQIRALWAMPAAFAEGHDDLRFTPPEPATIRAETLLVSGDRDPLYPVELAVEMYRAIPRARRLPGRGAPLLRGG
jgi:pimeloyl-ACP methyl ester carboxylesterase